MSGNSGIRTALTVVGTLVGAYVGGVAGAAIAIAFSVGSQLAFPDHNYGPRPQGTHATNSAPGSPMPKVYGVARVGGQLIWAAKPVQHEDNSSGKGGPTVTTYHYTQSIAMSFGEGPIAGFRRIWFDGKLVYDVTNLNIDFGSQDSGYLRALPTDQYLLWLKNARFLLNATFYLGTDTQNADPTIEAAKGVGNVPGYRGQCYIVWSDLDISQYGNRIPIITAELISAGDTVEKTVVELRNDFLCAWETANRLDPRACCNDHEYKFGATWYETLGEALAAGELSSGYPLHRAPIGWSMTAYGPMSPLATLDPGESEVLYLHFNQIAMPDAYQATEPNCADLMGGRKCWYNGSVYTKTENPYTPVPATGFATSTCLWDLDPSITYTIRFTAPGLHGDADYYGLSGPGGISNASHDYIFPGIVGAGEPDSSSTIVTYTPPILDRATASSGFIATIKTVNHITGAIGYNEVSYTSLTAICTPDGLSGFPGTSTSKVNPAPKSTLSCDYVSIYFVYDVIIAVRRKVRAPDNPCVPRCTDPYPLLPDNPEFCVISSTGNTVLAFNGNYSQDTASYKVLQGYQVSGGVVNKLPLGPVLISGDLSDTSAFWMAAYAAAVTAGTMASGLTYGVDYPVAKSYAWRRSYAYATLSPAAVTIGSIVADLCGRGNLAADQYDVTGLTENVTGYLLNAVTDAKSAIQPLQTFGFFDAVETGGKILFPLRGRAAVATLAASDLGARDGGAQTSSMTVQRMQEVELPRKVRVKYSDVANAYQDGLQASPERPGRSINITDLAMPIVMDANKAIQIACIVQDAAWIAREKQTFSLTSAWLDLIKPGDAVNVPIDGVTKRVRVLAIDYQFPGILNLQAERDEGDVYTSSAVGISPNTREPPAVTVTSPTAVVLADLPALTSDMNLDAGYLAAVYGLLPSWRGSEIYRSVDGGASYMDLLAAARASVVGITTTALGDWPEHRQIDQTNSVTVSMLAGAPAGTSLALMLNGNNLAAIGDNGRWEVVQFKNATLNGDGSYTLSSYFRGLNGTEWAASLHAVGDKFILLTGNLYRVANPVASINVPQKIKAVTNGTVLQNAAATNITPQGVNLKPLAPICLAGGRDADGNVLIKWVRRDRLATDMVAGSDVPLSESTEVYDIEIYGASTYSTVVRTITSNTQNVEYSAAEQAADFGSPRAAIYVRVYQRSASVGRGYAATAII